MSLEGLVKEFEPPATKSYPVSPSDFSAYQLTHPPPNGLIRLFETYGQGTFEDSGGNSLSLLFPTANSASFCRYVSSQHKILATDHGDLLEDSHTAGDLWKTFDDSGVSTSVECIWWAKGCDSQNFYYLWFSDITGWVAYVEDDLLTHAFCLFKSPVTIIQDAFSIQRSAVRSLFSRPSRPFRFVPSREE